MIEIKQLISNFSQNGMVTWISIRPERRSPVIELQEVEAIAGKGLSGDRYKSNGSRQVTLIQQEHLDAAASILGTERIDAALVRRNIVVKGINLVSLKGKQFRIGTVVLEHSGDCHPCSRMEENLGFGGYNAMRGHGGITARIVSGGIMHIGDAVVPLENIDLPVTELAKKVG
jgi:MOSC domain-containing protein YiiM